MVSGGRAHVSVSDGQATYQVYSVHLFYLDVEMKPLEQLADFVGHVLGVARLGSI